MPNTFFAFCRTNDRNQIYRIPVTHEVQGELEQSFDNQEQSFLANRNEEINFDGDWKPEPNQLLVITDEVLAEPFVQTCMRNPSVYDVLDVGQSDFEVIKGIFTHSEREDNRILLQRFQSSQYLQRDRLNLFWNNDIFSKFLDQGFTLDNKLTAIIQNNSFKFVSFSNLRTIIPIQRHFLEATSEEVDSFKQCGLFHLQNEEYFDNAMDEGLRKIIHRITISGFLNDYGVNEIQDRANSVGLRIESLDERLVLPDDKVGIKIILRFLDESVYKGAFSETTFETNSKRRI